MIWRHKRKARKRHRCHCENSIPVGAMHWEMVAVGEDFMGDGWWRLRECADCAERYNRPVSSSRENPNV